jgi:hypothetical protein
VKNVFQPDAVNEVISAIDKLPPTRQPVGQNAKWMSGRDGALLRDTRGGFRSRRSAPLAAYSVYLSGALLTTTGHFRRTVPRATIL